MTHQSRQYVWLKTVGLLPAKESVTLALLIMAYVTIRILTLQCAQSGLIGRILAICLVEYVYQPDFVKV